MIDIAEHSASEIRLGDRSYVPVARTWRVGLRRSGFSYTVPHRIEVTDDEGGTDWIRIPDPTGVVRLAAAIVLALGFMRRLAKGG